MMTMVENGGKIVAHTVSALGGTPLVLGLVLINCLFVGAIAWNSYYTNMRKDDLLAALARECLVFKHSGAGPQQGPLIR